MKKIVFLLVLTFTFSSCTQRIFDFTIVSTKNIELENLSNLKKGSKRTEGEDKASIIVLFSTHRISISQAIDNTIEGIPGCIALLDGVVTSKFWWIPYIYGEEKFIIEAVPLIDPSMQGTVAIPKFSRVYLDHQGKFKCMEAISSTDYEKEKRKIMNPSKRKLQ